MHFTVFCFLCHSGLEKLLYKGEKVSRDGRFEKMKKNVKVKHLCYLKLMMFIIKDLVLKHLLFKLATKQLTVKILFSS